MVGSDPTTSVGRRSLLKSAGLGTLGISLGLDAGGAAAIQSTLDDSGDEVKRRATPNSWGVARDTLLRVPLGDEQSGEVRVPSWISLDLVRRRWQDYGNPSVSSGETGCWRYTFTMTSFSTAMVSTVGVTKPQATFVHENEREDFPEHLFPYVDTLLSVSTARKPFPHLRESFAIVGPRDGTDAQDGIAISERRDKDYIGFASVDAVLESIKQSSGTQSRYEVPDEFDFGTGPPETVKSEYGNQSRGFDLTARKIEKLNDARKAFEEESEAHNINGALTGLSLGVATASVVSGGLALPVAGLGVAMYKGLRHALDKPEMGVPMYRGFEYARPEPATGCVGLGFVTFDVYVDPETKTGFLASGDVTTAQELNELDVEHASPDWAVMIDPPESRDADTLPREDLSVDWEHSTFNKGFYSQSPEKKRSAIYDDQLYDFSQWASKTHSSPKPAIGVPDEIPDDGSVVVDAHDTKPGAAGIGSPPPATEDVELEYEPPEEMDTISRTRRKGGPTGPPDDDVTVPISTGSVAPYQWTVYRSDDAGTTEYRTAETDEPELELDLKDFDAGDVEYVVELTVTDDRGNAATTRTPLTTTEDQAVQEGVVDDFEDDEFPEYEGDVERLTQTAQATPSAFHGDGSLLFTTDGNKYDVYSTSGLPNYPEQGQTFSCNARLTRPGDFFWVTWGHAGPEEHYMVEVDSQQEHVKLYRRQGQQHELDTVETSVPEKTWLDVTVDWGTDDTITVTVSDTETDQVLGRLSAEDSEFAGEVGAGFRANNRNANGSELFFDYYRTGTELADTDSDPDDGATQVIDDFADGDLSEYEGAWEDGVVTEWEGDEPPNGGQNILEMDAGRDILSHDGLPAYPERGDRFEFTAHFDDVEYGEERDMGVAFGAQDDDRYYVAWIGQGDDPVQLSVVYDGASSNWKVLDATDTGVPKDEWLRGVVDWGQDGEISFVVEDADGVTVAEVSGRHEKWDEGGIGWIAKDNSGDATYFGSAHVLEDGDGDVPDEEEEPDGENGTPDAEFKWIPAQPTSDAPVTFDGTDSSDPDGNGLAYDWEIVRDGQTVQRGQNPTYETSLDPGEYDVTLRVTDTDGDWDEMSVPVTIEEPAEFTTAIEKEEIDGGYLFTAKPRNGGDDVDHEWTVTQQGTVEEGGTGKTYEKIGGNGAYQILLESTADDGTTVDDDASAYFGPGEFGVSIETEEIDGGYRFTADPENVAASVEHEWTISHRGDVVETDSGDSYELTGRTGQHTIELESTDRGRATDTASETVYISGGGEFGVTIDKEQLDDGGYRFTAETENGAGSVDHEWTITQQGSVYDGDTGAAYELTGGNGAYTIELESTDLGGATDTATASAYFGTV